ncbi:hypothetical protein [Chthonobacter rhizosphaerae]|uniref:hypothetical protein n=1 Tax=Chthonobacter rhizosphaerae TaxID=2735553 RepID=UPI0015EEBB6E|nr:hypothetical protein [Chthonobacter rhizosphaerae]
MKILVCIPAYRQSVSTTCLQSLVQLFTSFGKSYDHISLDLKIAQATVVHRARNAFASVTLEDPSYSHMLLVDPDIGFRPSLLERMLAFDEPVVGATYPTGALNRDAFAERAREVSTGAEAEICALDYAGGGDAVMLSDNPAEQGAKDLILRNGFMRVARVGNDLLLVRRDALERIHDAYPELYLPNGAEPYRQFGITGPVLQAFDPMTEAPTGLFGDEDAFAQRWAATGGDLWACFVEPVQRRVEDTIAGHFLTKLQFGHV